MVCLSYIYISKLFSIQLSIETPQNPLPNFYKSLNIVSFLGLAVLLWKRYLKDKISASVMLMEKVCSCSNQNIPFLWDLQFTVHAFDTNP